MELSKNFPTIFGQPRDNTNIVFAIDTSGSMYNKLDSVKTHLIEFLLNLANYENVSFNIIEFNSEIRCWADKMVACNQSTVEVALPWIKSLAPRTGTNTLDALVTAFENECDSVYLVTDGLPDQHPFDILDEIVYTSNHRPVHCVYLTGDRSDATAIRFLERLSVETHGSFLMASIVRYGVMEKVTPVYAANHSAEKMVRSNTGTHYPSASKLCSVTTSLTGDPLLMARPLVMPYDGLIYPYFYQPYWWTRYHTAKTFMRAASRHGDSLAVSNMGVSPSAAILLIGQKVVARREEDGYYYPGTVTNQLNADVFLVQFKTTDVGDYKDTKYQETAIYDIISFNDALRHPVIPGDRVLAPTINGYYSPAIVIDGMEHRGGNGLDSPVTVSFSDGRTRSLDPNTAIWIPGSLFDRVSLEIKVPAKARKPMKAVDGYPCYNLPGYPRSGTIPVPTEYRKLYPSVVDCGDVLMDSTWFGWPQFVGLHSAMYKPHGSPPVSYKASDLEKLFGKTIEIQETKDEEKQEEPPAESEEVKEEAQEEVQEEVKEEVKEEEVEETKEEENAEDAQVDISEEEYRKLLEEIADFETTKYVYPRPKRSKSAYVPWKNHWKNDGIPDLIEPNRPGPFRDTTLTVPMELREQRIGESGGHNPYSQFFSAKSGRNPRYKESSIYRMSVLPEPRPPSCPHPRQEPGEEFTKSLGSPQKVLEDKEQKMRECRRQVVIQREHDRVSKILEDERTSKVMREQQRERALERMEAQRAHLEAERDAVMRLQESKRLMTRELCNREAERTRQEQEKSQHRLDARRAAQIERAENEARRRMMEHEREQRERAAKDARCQELWQQRHDQLENDERQRLLHEARLRGVKVGRRERFRMLESRGQATNDLKATVFKDNQALFQSSIR